MNRTISSANRKARRPHRCSICEGPIPPGAVYLDEVLTHQYGGDGIWHWRTCQACQDDDIEGRVTEWAGLVYDAGITDDDCLQWARDVVSSLDAAVAVWPPEEVAAARRFLSRVGGSDGDI